MGAMASQYPQLGGKGSSSHLLYDSELGKF